MIICCLVSALHRLWGGDRWVRSIGEMMIIRGNSNKFGGKHVPVTFRQSEISHEAI
jgi:hypothetical protein